MLDATQNEKWSCDRFMSGHVAEVRSDQPKKPLTSLSGRHLNKSSSFMPKTQRGGIRVLELEMRRFSESGKLLLSQIVQKIKD